MRRSYQQSTRPGGAGSESSAAIDELQAIPENGGDAFEFSAAGATYFDVPHNLGRWYRGATLWGQSVPRTSCDVAVMTPEGHKALGRDPSKTFGLSLSSSATVTVRGRVF